MIKNKSLDPVTVGTLSVNGIMLEPHDFPNFFKNFFFFGLVTIFSVISSEYYRDIDTGKDYPKIPSISLIRENLPTNKWLDYYKMKSAIPLTILAIVVIAAIKFNLITTQVAILVAAAAIIIIEKGPIVLDTKKKLRERFLGLALISLLLFVSISTYFQDSQVTKYSANSGELDGKLTRDNVKHILIEAGNSGNYWLDALPMVTAEGESVFEGFRMWLDNGKVKMSAIIRDSTGSILAQLDANEWQVNRNKIFDRNFDSNGIEVIDEKGEVILQADITGRFEKISNGALAAVVTFKGVFIDKRGRRWCVGTNLPENESSHRVLLAKVVPQKLSTEKIGFQRIFKYPSEQHPGERSSLQ